MRTTDSRADDRADACSPIVRPRPTASRSVANFARIGPSSSIGAYTILGACNRQLASRGLALEPDLGVLLPCNVVVRAADGHTHIAAMEPIAAMQLADNPALEPIATEARERLQKAVQAA